MINARRSREGGYHAAPSGPEYIDDNGYLPHYWNLVQVRRIAYSQRSPRLRIYPPVTEYNTRIRAREKSENRVLHHFQR